MPKKPPKAPKPKKQPPKPPPVFDSADISYGPQHGAWGTGAKLESGKRKKKPSRPQ